MIYRPHTGYRTYKLPCLIIHASDLRLTVANTFGESTITRLEDWPTSGRTLYSTVPADDLLLYGDPELWTVRTWNGRVSYMEYAGVRIHLLPVRFDDDTLSFFDCLDDLGVAAGSVNTMALNTWRSTLERPVGFREIAGAGGDYLGVHAARIGGRKEAIPGTYRNRIEYDIPHAYPAALGRTDIPEQLDEVDVRVARRADFHDWHGIAEANVRVPPQRWGPLPLTVNEDARLVSYGFTGGSRWHRVVLPLHELRHAESVGCDVAYTRIRAGRRVRHCFMDWLNVMVPTLRSLNGSAGALGKLTCNRLWSCFAIDPDGVRREHTMHGGAMVTTDIAQDSPGRAEAKRAVSYMGAMVSASVRVRLHREALTQLDNIVYVDTDGVITRTAETMPDGWHAKAEMRYLEIAASQCYRYKCPLCLPAPAGHAGPHFVVAGASTLPAKSRMFEAIKAGAMLVTNLDTTLPPMDVTDGEVRSTPAGEPSEAVAWLDAAYARQRKVEVQRDMVVSVAGG